MPENNNEPANQAEDVAEQPRLGRARAFLVAAGYNPNDIPPPAPVPDNYYDARPYQHIQVGDYEAMPAVVGPELGRPYPNIYGQYQPMPANRPNQGNAGNDRQRAQMVYDKDVIDLAHRKKQAKERVLSHMEECSMSLEEVKTIDDYTKLLTAVYLWYLLDPVHTQEERDAALKVD